MDTQTDVPVKLGPAMRHFLDTMIPAIDFVQVLTGFDELDKIGLFNSRLLVVAAEYDRIASHLAMAIAANVALGRTSDKNVRRVGIFSLKSTLTEYVCEMATSEAKVSPHAVSGGFVSQKNRALLEATAELYQDCPIFIDDTPFLHAKDLIAKAKTMKADLGIELLIIDKFALIEGGTATAADQDGLPYYQQTVARLLRDMARDLNVAVMVLTGARPFVKKTKNKGTDALSDSFARMDTVQYPRGYYADDMWLLEWSGSAEGVPNDQLDCLVRVRTMFGDKDNEARLHYARAFAAYSNWPACEDTKGSKARPTRCARGKTKQPPSSAAQPSLPSMAIPCPPDDSATPTGSSGL